MAKTSKTKTTSATLGFEQQIWDAACELWGHIPAADYRKIFTGLIFLKYISTAFEKKYTELVEEGEGFENDPDEYEAENLWDDTVIKVDYALADTVPPHGVCVYKIKNI